MSGLRERVIATVYTPGIGPEFDQRSVGVWAGDTHVEVPCWGGCVDGIYEGPSPDSGRPCVECRGRGVRPVWLL